MRVIRQQLQASLKPELPNTSQLGNQLPSTPGQQGRLNHVTGTRGEAHAYQQSPPKLRRDINHAICKKIYVSRDGIAGIELRELFQLLLHPVVVAAAQWHHQKTTKTAEPPEASDSLARLFFDLVDSTRNRLVTPEARNKQTTDTEEVGGLRELHVVALVQHLSHLLREVLIPEVPTILTPFQPVVVPAMGCSLLVSDEISRIAELYEAGATLAELATLFNIHKSTVTAHLDRQGVNRRVNKRQMNDEQVREAARMYANSNSLSKIGARFGADGSTVSRELRKIGVQIRPQGVRY